MLHLHQNSFQFFFQKGSWDHVWLSVQGRAASWWQFQKQQRPSLTSLARVNQGRSWVYEKYVSKTITGSVQV